VAAGLIVPKATGGEQAGITDVKVSAFDIEAHRGGRALFPENTLVSFANALSIGVDTLELDVGATRDGVLVVSHERGLNPDLARGADGNARKYRVMMIGGKLFPLHLAISRNWKVHYFTSDMADKPDHRREEMAFLQNMPAVLGDKAIAALHAICKALALDYAGIDFAVNADGDLLLFEANATMVIASPDNDPRWAYRRGPITAAIEAVTEMIKEKAGSA